MFRFLQMRCGGGGGGGSKNIHSVVITLNRAQLISFLLVCCFLCFDLTES